MTSERFTSVVLEKLIAPLVWAVQHWRFTPTHKAFKEGSRVVLDHGYGKHQQVEALSSTGSATLKFFILLWRLLAQPPSVNARLLPWRTGNPSSAQRRKTLETVLL